MAVPVDMDNASWLAYFEANRLRTLVTARDDCGATLPAPLRRAVLHSLQRLQLGESGEGSIIEQAKASSDPAVDDAICRAIELYIREENRHGRELADVIDKLGGEVIREHWTSTLFTGGRHLLGLRTKMLTITAAEVVGVEFYRLLLERVPDGSIAALAATIIREEERHLLFQKHWVERTVRLTPNAIRPGYMQVYRAWYTLIQAAAIAVFLLDHRALLRETGIGKRGFARRCVRRARDTIFAAFDSAEESFVGHRSLVKDLDRPLAASSTVSQVG